MKKTLIRNSAFETNSSSQHSITLGTDKGLPFIVDSLYPDKEGIVHIPMSDFFGRFYERFNDALTKAQYAALAAVEYNQFDLEILTEVIKDVTGCEKVFYGGGGYDFGEIDHESVALIGERVASWAASRDRNYERLKDFVFNQNSWLFTGSDETNPSVSFFHVPVFGVDGEITQPKRNQQLAIEGCDGVVVLCEKYTEEEVEIAIEEIIEKDDIKNGNLIETRWKINHEEKTICTWDYNELYAEAAKRLEERYGKADPADLEYREKIIERRIDIYNEILKEGSLFKYRKFTITEI